MTPGERPGRIRAAPGEVTQQLRHHWRQDPPSDAPGMIQQVAQRAPPGSAARPSYLRRTYPDGTAKNQTAPDLSALPDHIIDLIDAGPKGPQPVPPQLNLTRSARAVAWSSQ